MVLAFYRSVFAISGMHFNVLRYTKIFQGCPFLAFFDTIITLFVLNKKPNTQFSRIGLIINIS